MEKAGKVSLWLGNFDSEKNFRNFMKMRFTDDGDLLPLEFKLEFNIRYYDIDFSEINYMKEESDKLETILRGFSNDDEIIPQFNKIFNKSIYNSIVLLYDFEYDCNTHNYKNGDNELNFIGTVNYSK